MLRNLRIVAAWLMRGLATLPKWWGHDYKEFRIIIEQSDGQLRYFRIPGGFQRAAARSAIFVVSLTAAALAGLGLTSYLLNKDNSRLEQSAVAIYSTLLGDALADTSSFSEKELLGLVQDIKDRQSAIQQYLGLSAIAFKEENQSLMGQLLDTGLTEKTIRAIEKASVGGGIDMEVGGYSSPQNLLPDSLVSDILENRELSDILRALPDQAPLKQFDVSSDFGIRKHPLSGKVHFHSGVDLVANGQDDSVYPAKAGRVTTAATHPQLGNMVIIDHSNGIQTLYAHLKSIGVKVKVGDYVQIGTPIGIVGNTGASSTGPHLHFEVLVGGFAANPIKVIRAARNVQQIQ